MTGSGMATGLRLNVQKWNSWESKMCSAITLEGFKPGLVLSATLSSSPGFPWAKVILKKNRLTRLKAATNKDLDRPDTILSSKFAAKIGAEAQIMKTVSKIRWSVRVSAAGSDNY